MSYNRLDPTTPSYYSNDPMDQGQYRTPSPGHPIQQGYGHDPYGSHSQPGLEMPPLPPGSDQRPSPGRFGTPDQLQMNAPNSVSDLSRPDGGSYFNANNPQPADYAFNPQAHLDAYPNQPYQPSPQFSQEGLDASSYDYDDRRPMLAGSDSSEPYRDELTPRPQPQPQQGGGQQPLQSQPGNGSSVGVRRWKTVKQVLLYRGNLVLDCPVPPRLLGQVPHTERDEFTHMRYSAATCDPSDFVDDNFTLRQKLFSKPRQTELFIVVTMYNEEETLLGRTLMGVFKNIEYMCRRTESKTWGKDAWKKIVVCVVSDGRSKINPRSRALLAGLGVYQEGIAKQKVNDKDVTAHIYEYTTQMGLFEKSGVIGLTPKQQPVQMLFCLKEKNQKKINSHRWFFQAFGAVLEPNICVLIDAGTRPGGNSIYHLWKAFDLEPTCAGACGEIKAMLGTGGKYLFNPLVATQNFEYKMSNILDKPLESAFGFISVLPGAFSAYRYVALQNDKDNKGPLEKYFTGETLHGSNAGVFTSNMYLAEDRILCFELVTKRNCHWILQYVKSATGETDVPNTVTELILQRRRWLNGSFFAAIYAIAHFHQFFRSDHSLLRKLMFFLEFVFSTINMIFSWFAIGNFFLVFKILTTSLSDPTLLGITGKILGIVFSWLYGACLLTCFVLSLGNRPAGTRLLYTLMVYFWAIIMVYLMFAAVFISVEAIISDVHDANGFSVADLFKNPIFYTLIVSVLSTYGIWFIASIIMFDPWHMFTSFIQYMLLTPTYVNILNVYAFCNTHDVTWGTKGDDRPDKLPSVSTKDGAGKTDLPDSTDLDAQYERELAEFRQKEVKVVTAKTPVQEQEAQLDYYRNFRSIVVLVWLVTNFALVALVLNAAGVERITPDASSSNQKENLYMTIVLWSVAGLSAFKFIGAMWFLIVRIFRGV